MKTVWVLTREINDYNQEGCYFVAVFAAKPTTIQMAEALKGMVQGEDLMTALAFVEHVRGGGGRRGDENEWYHLEETPLIGGKP